MSWTKPWNWALTRRLFYLFLDSVIHRSRPPQPIKVRELRRMSQLNDRHPSPLLSSVEHRSPSLSREAILRSEMQ